MQAVRDGSVRLYIGMLVVFDYGLLAQRGQERVGNERLTLFSAALLQPRCRIGGGQQAIGNRHDVAGEAGEEAVKFLQQLCGQGQRNFHLLLPRRFDDLSGRFLRADRNERQAVRYAEPGVLDLMIALKGRVDGRPGAHQAGNDGGDGYAVFMQRGK